MRVYNSAFIPTYGFVFCWARVAVMCFFGPSSCVSEMKYGILRYNMAGLDIKMITYTDFIYVSFKHILINLTSCMGTPNSMRMLYNTSLLTE
jgi:hypothetical protein